MAKASATNEAIELALATPSLGVGCHVALVDGEPVLHAQNLPTLVDPRTGRYYPTPVVFLKRLLTGRIRSAEIEAEANAQISLLQSRGVRLTHIDTHKHVHSFPGVLRPVLRAAKAAGIQVVRNPFEPEWSLRATHGVPWLRRAQMWLLRLLEPSFLLRKLPEGTWELVTHPGYNDSDLDRVRTRLRASREIERKLLLAIAPQDGVEFISFAQLATEDTRPSEVS